jgi:hypothetical protein
MHKAHQMHETMDAVRQEGVTGCAAVNFVSQEYGVHFTITCIGGITWPSPGKSSAVALDIGVRHKQMGWSAFLLV